MPRFSYTKKLMVFGYVQDGDTVHYVDMKTRERLLAGRVAEKGILVEGQPEPVSLAKFEALAGRYYVKAPSRYIILPSGRSIEDALNEIRGSQPAGDTGTAPRSRKGRGRKSKEYMDEEEIEASEPQVVALSLLEDENDQYCAYCGHGGQVVELRQCSSCPTVLHATCPSVEDILRAHQAMEIEGGATRSTGEMAGGATETAQAKDGAEMKAANDTRTAGHSDFGGHSNARDSWHCPACLCCMCGKSIDVLGDQYRGAVHVVADAETGPYVDILDSSIFNRLHIRHPIPEAEGPGVGSERTDKVTQGQEPASKALSSGEDANVNTGALNGKGNGREKHDQDVGQAAGQISTPPAPPAPPSASHVVISASGARAHASCVQQFPHGLANGEPFNKDGDRAILAGLAKLCLRGAVNIGSYAENKQVSFQIIHAAAATGRDIYGVAPLYSEDQKLSLRKVISACWSVVKDSYEEIWDSRTGMNLAPMMLQGACNLPFLDYSGMFLAALFIDSSIVSVVCFRVLGPVAEMPVVATRRDLRGIKAASTLLARLDHELHNLGVKALVTQATYKDGPRRFFPYTPSLNPPGAPLPPPGQEAFGFQIARKAYVDAVISRGGFSVPGISWAECETGRWANWSTWSSKLGEIKVELSPALDIKSRLTLMMIKRVPRSKAPALEMGTEVKRETSTQEEKQLPSAIQPATMATATDASLKSPAENDGFKLNGKVEMGKMADCKTESEVNLDDKSIEAKDNNNEDENVEIECHQGAHADITDGSAHGTGAAASLGLSPMLIDSKAGNSSDTSALVVKSLVDGIMSRLLAQNES